MDDELSVVERMRDNNLRQEKIEWAYHVDGRNSEKHEFHSLYTGLGEQLNRYEWFKQELENFEKWNQANYPY